MNGIPSYAAWWVLNVADVYRLTGDRAFAAHHADRINDILADLCACIGETDTDFSRTGKHTDMPFFLDWPTFETPEAVTGTHLLMDYTLSRLTDCALPHVDTAAVPCLSRRLARYRSAPTESKAVAALQVLCGSSRTDQLRTQLEADGARDFSAFMSYFQLTAMDRAGCVDTLDVAKTYYGGMLDRGATTFWEDFSVDWLTGSGCIDEVTPADLRDIHADYGAYCYAGLKKSLCHGWSVGILPYFVECVLGITPAAPGYETVRIIPNLGSLAWAEGCIPTPHGPITVRAEAGKSLHVVLPTGVTPVP